MPATSTDTCQEEINHLQTWAAENNLRLNRNKTKEIVFTSSRKRMLPPPCPGIQRLSSLRIHGVIVNDKMTAADHVTMLLWSCSSVLYAMRVLRAHDIPATSLYDVFRATVVSRSSMRRQHGRKCVHQLNMAVLTRLEHRSKRLGCSNNDLPSIVELFC